MFRAHASRRDYNAGMRILLRLLVLVLGAWLLICLAAFLLQRRLQYFPDAEDPARPRGKAYEGLEDVTLEASDGVRLKAWYWPGESDLVLLVLHGNAGNRADRLEWMTPFHDRGWGVFLLDYRGYGGSDGHPSEEGFLRDADAAHAWLVDRGVRRIVPVGESIGAGVAVPLAARKAVSGLIVQSGALAIVDVARRAYPFLPLGILLRDTYDNRDAAAAVAVPSLVVHGTKDEIVPLALGRALHDALGGGSTWYPVEGARHNDLPWAGGPAYVDRVHAFLAALP